MVAKRMTTMVTSAVEWVQKRTKIVRNEKKKSLETSLLLKWFIVGFYLIKNNCTNKLSKTTQSSLKIKRFLYFSFSFWVFFLFVFRTCFRDLKVTFVTNDFCIYLNFWLKSIIIEYSIEIGKELFFLEILQKYWRFFYLFALYILT